MPRQPDHQQPASTKIPPEAGQGQRLQKVLAAAGIASRRQCEALIEAGRVEVDGRTVTRLGTRVDPLTQQVRVDGDVLTRPQRVYYAVNKPVGVVSTNRDPEGRPRVIDLVPATDHLFVVGRLDRSSEGLMLVTNDGELANRLTHPRYEVPKTYRVRVAGRPGAAILEQLRQGVRLAEGVARVASVKVKTRFSESTELEVVLTEGRNREIRRVLAKVGHKVVQLRRVAIGPLRLGMMAPGEYRNLSGDEVRRLEQSVHGCGATRGTRSSKPKKTRPAAAGRPAATAGPRTAGQAKGEPPRPRVVLDYEAAQPKRKPRPSSPAGRPAKPSRRRKPTP